MLAGFVAGEGSFYTSRERTYADGSPRLRFRFQVTVASRDRHLLEQLQHLLGYGSITDRSPARPGYQPTSELRICRSAPTARPPSRSRSGISCRRPSAGSSRRGERRWTGTSPLIRPVGGSVRRSARNRDAESRSAVAVCAVATTTVPPVTDFLAVFIGGFVAAEGNFRSAGYPPKFTFAVGLGATDLQICEDLRVFFGVGSVHWRPRRRAHYDDEVTFQVRSRRHLLDVVVPFMDDHLPPSHKRQQYLEWRHELVHGNERPAHRLL